MRKALILIPSLLFASLLSLAAQEPVRVTVEVENSGTVSLFYMDLADGLPADLHLPETRVNGKTYFAFPDDGRIFFCFLKFENTPEQPFSSKIILMPGESIEIKGEIRGTHPEISITGSEMLSAWSEHKKSYREHELAIMEEGLDGCDPGTTDYPEKMARYNELVDNINREMYAFMKANPEHPLSAYYYGFDPGGDYRRDYDMLTGRLKEGDYKRLLDYAFELFEAYEDKGVVICD